LIDFLKENFIMPENFSEEDSFLEKGIIDSTGVIELVTFLEESFDIKINDEEIIPENLDSIKNIIDFLKFKKN
ncbi:MAG: acyl carrier protein, partial [Candidatus Helarchaeota archaeon]